MYKKQEWNNGTRLDAVRLNHIEDGIYGCSRDIEALKSSITNSDFQEFQNYVNNIIEELTEKIEKQKKEITSLKTKVTKLQKAPKAEEE